MIPVPLAGSRSEGFASRFLCALFHIFRLRVSLQQPAQRRERQQQVVRRSLLLQAQNKEAAAMARSGHGKTSQLGLRRCEAGAFRSSWADQHVPGALHAGEVLCGKAKCSVMPYRWPRWSWSPRPTMPCWMRRWVSRRRCYQQGPW